MLKLMLTQSSFAGAGTELGNIRLSVPSNEYPEIFSLPKSMQRYFHTYSNLSQNKNDDPNS